MKIQHMAYLFFCTLAAILFVLPQSLFSAIVVDPDGIGANDVDPSDPATWNNNTSAYVGNTTAGALRVDGGSRIESFNGYIGYESASSGSVSIDGSGSGWTCHNGLGVGYYGSGTLTIINGGKVSSESYISIGGWDSVLASTVTVDGSGSTLTCGGELYVGDYGDSSGKLTITNRGLVSIAGTLDIDPDADGGSFINMYCGGMLALLGDADDSLASFLGLVTGTDAIHYWDNSVSGWADISGATLGSDCTLSYQSAGDLAGYTLLTVQAALGGDANGDGAVNVSDLGVLATNYGTASGAEWSDADFNGDGKVDVIDLGVLATTYGNTTAAASSQAVPEPSGVVLLVMGTVALLANTRRKRS